MYEVYYELVTGGASVPVNRRALLDVRYFDNDESITLPIPMVQIHGVITVNGEDPPDSVFGLGAHHPVRPGDGGPRGDR